jgi:Bacterial protein of unknown function (DUF922)
MLQVKKYIAVILFFLPFTLSAQEKDEELVDWSAARKLSWADYKANPARGSDVAASTTTYLGIEYTISDKSFGFKIQCRFSKNRSWGLHKTDYILEHEQGHFDIAEIFARKLNKAMNEYSFNKRTYQKDLNKMYQDIMKEKEEMQDKYDKETNHSIHKVNQAEWLKKIASLLEDYKDFAGYS